MQVSEDVHGIWTMQNATAQLIEQLQTSLRMCRDQLEAALSLVKQSEWADQQLKVIDDIEENLDAQLKIADELEVAFIMLRNTINVNNGLVVSTAGKQPGLQRPRLQTSMLPMTALKRLLTETCQGVQDDDLLGLHPDVTLAIEGLHLALNTGNSAYEHARNVLSLLVDNKGDARDSAAVARAADSWTAPKAGFIQTPQFKEQGFDFQQHVEKVFSPKLKMPLTKVHGIQLETLFKQQSTLWNAEPRKSALADLKEDRDLGVFIRDLQTAMGCTI
jgi:hypothetical protein